tara:strand:- start:9206 stop:9436 length:231 start_codon:yes stop_codon:yes gene_type:complete
MTDKNEKYVYESQEDVATKDRVIVRTFDAPQEEKFSITQLEEKLAKIDDQIVDLEASKAPIQEKIDEATVALAEPK